ncbi:uncharacterized protein LOC115455537 [Manduca sexta]|uniref:uncharacterized protein LOC115455537 n=1 Tax=Manduca sexta TaxID=7130 RepID=UPI00188DD85D|nr:uncharacterized protein LOC115455537 [Manduca sexta]
MSYKKYFDSADSDSDAVLETVEVTDVHPDRLACNLHWRVLFCFVMLMGLAAASILYLTHVPLTATPVPCTMELATVKHQLEVETEYKGRIEKLLADAQRYHEADKDRFKYLMQSCFAITQQNFFWKYQLDDLLQEIGTTQESN